MAYYNSYNSEALEVIDEETTGIQNKIAKRIVNEHGSGIDYTWNAYLQKNGTLVLSNSYHMMDQYGGYVGWCDFNVKVDSEGSIERISLHNAPKRARDMDLLEYLYDVFYHLEASYKYE